MFDENTRIHPDCRDTELFDQVREAPGSSATQPQTDGSMRGKEFNSVVEEYWSTQGFGSTPTGVSMRNDLLESRGPSNANGGKPEEPQYLSAAADHDNAHQACEAPNNGAATGPADTLVSACTPEAHLGKPSVQLPVDSQGTQNIDILPQSESPSGSITSYKTKMDECGGAGKVRDVGIADQSVPPQSGRTMLDEGAVASERASVSWDSTGGQKIDDSAHTPHLGVGHSAPLTAWDDTPSGLCNQRDEEGADENTPMRSVLGQQRLPHHTPTPESEPDNNGSGVVFDGRRQITMPVADATQVIDFEPDGLPNSVSRYIYDGKPTLATSALQSPPMASSPQPRVGMNAASTPPSSYEAPPLASPVQLQVESNAQYTPPSSPMKLSSPPPLKQLKKAARIRTGLGAPFRSPFPGPLHYALPSSLPPSSPPPIPTSPPQVQLAKKKRHADSDSEDQPAPTKVRRLGLAPFVSPLRNPQADGATPAKPYTRPPAGGFSTPLRPPRARAQNSNFSSPIVPSQPDVFTTPATASAARSSPACTRPDTKPASSSMFDPTPSSSSKSAAYKPRHPRAVTRPFKPPAKSTRPTSATIQALRQRLQVLRNALRIRGIADPTKPTESSQPTKVFDDDELEALGLQWRTAARDTAQDLWALVRDTASADSWGAEGSKPVGGGKEESWGWDAKPQQTYQARVCTEDQDLEETQGGALFTPPGVDKVHQAMVKNLNRPVVPRKTMLPPHQGPEERVSLQEDEMEDSEHEDEPKHYTLGTMLASLGIPPEVLGWQEEEGEFVD